MTTAKKTRMSAEQQGVLNAARELSQDVPLKDVPLSKILAKADVLMKEFLSWGLERSHEAKDAPFWEAYAKLQSPEAVAKEALDPDAFVASRVVRAPKPEPIIRLRPAPLTEFSGNGSQQNDTVADESRHLNGSAKQLRKEDTHFAAILGKTSGPEVATSPADIQRSAEDADMTPRPVIPAIVHAVPEAVPAAETAGVDPQSVDMSTITHSSHLPSRKFADIIQLRELDYDGADGKRFREAIKEKRGNIRLALKETEISPETLVKWIQRGAGTRDAIELTAKLAGNLKAASDIDAIGTEVMTREANKSYLG